MKKKLSGVLSVIMIFAFLITGNANHVQFFYEEDEVYSAEGEIIEEEQELKLDYLVVEKAKIETPDTQRIIASFGEDNSGIVAAELCYENTETGKEQSIGASTINTDGVVFEIPYTDGEEGIYVVKSLTYTVGEQSVLLVMENIGMDIRYGVDMEVTTKPDAIVVEQEEETEESMSIVSFDEQGNQTSEVSIGEAIENARTETEDGVGTLRLASNGNVVVVLDPGHDDTHGGASDKVNEAQVNLKIALACREELEKYNGVEVYMTRETGACPYPGTSSSNDNANRVAYAQSVGANVYVSIHCNSGPSSAKGVEVYYPNSNYNAAVGQAGKDLASQVQNQLVALGITDRGIKVKDSESGDTYPDGSLADFYGVIRRSKLAGFPGIIIEHGFVTNDYDVNNFLGTDEGCRKLGVADATAIANYFNLGVGNGYVYNGVDYEAVFNADYYYNHNADVAKAVGYNQGRLLKHFVEYGMSEGRQATSIFNVQYYKNSYGDLRNAYGNNLQSYYMHFIKSGIYEGRQGSSTFNVQSYRNQYADLRKTYGNTYKPYYLHYVYYGEKEGRKGTGCTTLQGATTVYNGVNYAAVYDYYYYVNKYSDIKNKYGIDDAAVLAHFINYGMTEGRQGSSNFDVNSYRNQYADLRAAYGTNLKSYYLHYINYGKKEGRKGTGCTTLQGAITVYNGVNYAAVYDYNSYVNKNSDIKKAYGDNDTAVLAHFVNYGMNEGRQGSSNFDVNSYRRQYADLRAAYGTNLKSYYLHYINYGKKEGRKGTGCTSLQGATTVYNGVNYAAVYDYNSYVNKNSDIKKAYGDNDTAVLEHFVNYGMNEGRQAKSNFNVHSYKARYEDLQKAFGNDLKKYYQHYINYGQKEGRTGA